MNTLHVNKIINKITFKIKTRYCLELLTPETMKLLKSTKSKIKKDENRKNVGYLEISKVVLVHCNIIVIFIKKNSESCTNLFLLNL